jgi:hypothetical protein
MKFNLKSIIVGFVIACVLLMSVSVFASDGMSYLGVFKDASAVFINNVRVEGTNFLWNEKTYVAIEDVATALGLNYSKLDGNISVAGVVPTGVTVVVPTPTPTIEPIINGLLEEEPTPTPEVTPEPTPEITPQPTPDITPTPEPVVMDLFIDLSCSEYPGPPYYYIRFQNNDISTGKIAGIGSKSFNHFGSWEHPISAEVKSKLGRSPVYFEVNEDGNIIKIWH